MFVQVITSILFVDLCEKQQEIFAGGADFELSNTNFAQRVKASLDSSASSPIGYNNFSFDWDQSVNTAAQNLLGVGGNIPENIPPLPPPPVL
ncbi:MAG TPA: CTB family bacteriocin [Nostocaceae cyanobacterium]|nr:CTB family bacteriocin [Nostocaceae cyanobacterium]